MSICPHAGAWGQNPKFSGLSILATPIEIFRFLDIGHPESGNTLIKPNYASVRQSRDSLHRDTHNVTKKSRGGAVLWNRLS